MSDCKYGIVFYCPDTNLVYDGSTPDRRGIGGGKTVIVRLAKAFAALGHKVTCFVNCEAAGVFSGVHYRHFSEAGRIECDILIALTTGGELDLSPLKQIPVRARVKIISVHGSPKPRGLEDIPYDFIYVVSYYIKKVVIEQWGIPSHKVVVFYNGVEEGHFQEAEKIHQQRDPFAVVYPFHPAKGVDVVIDVVRALRERDPRFHLDIYGGYELYGQPFQSISEQDGISFKGLFGQEELAKRLFSYGLCFSLQEYPEPCGIAILEAKRSGVIVVASKVGAFPEIILDGRDGFLNEEYYRDVRCKEKVLEVVGYLMDNEDYARFIRDNAKRTTLSWEQVATSMILHCERFLNGGKSPVKRFVLNGWYGAGNLGDEAVLKCTMDSIRDIVPEADITVVSADPFYTEMQFHCNAVNRNNLRDIDRAVRKSDYVLLGGGGLFQDYQPIKPLIFFEEPYSGVTSYATVPVMAKIYNRPLMFYAQGVGPLFTKDSCDFTRFAYELADSITVRDDFSLELLKFIGIDEQKVHLTADPVVNLGILPEVGIKHIYFNEGIPSGKKIVSVVVRFWLEKYKEDRIVKALAGAINDFVRDNPGYCFVFIPFCAAPDMEINKKIVDLVEWKNNVFLMRRVYSLEETATFISRSEALIGMRFHSCVFAALGEVPFIALNYDYKVQMFAREMGLEDFVVELPDIESDHITARLYKLLESRGHLSKIVGQRLAVLSEKERGNKTFLQDFIRGNKKKAEGGNISFLSELLGIMQKQIISLNAEMEYKGAEILSLQASTRDLITERDQLNMQLDSLAGTRGLQSNELVELQRSVQGEEREIQRLTETNRYLTEKLQNTEEYLQSVLHSRTWRLGELYAKIVGQTFLRRFIDRTVSKILSRH